MYKPKYFRTYELVPKNIYEKYGSFAISAINPKLLEVIDKIKEDLSPIMPVYINDWFWGGLNEQRGLRSIHFYKGKLSLSQHLYGNAADMIFSHITETCPNKQHQIESYNVLRNHIISKIKIGEKPYSYIKGLETNISWLHVDVRNVEKLMIFEP